MALGKKWLALVAMMILLGASGAWAANVDIVYVNGKIYPMDDLKSGDSYDFSRVKDLNANNLRTVEVVAVRNGRIVFAGSSADAEAQGMLDAARTIDLQGRSMLPAFIDGHGHFPMQGSDDLYRTFLGSPPLGTMTSIADYVAALNQACENARPGDGVVGTGYDDTLITDMRHPTWMDLEGAPACAGKDIRLSHISGHVAVASKSLLIKAGLMSDDGTPTELARNTPGVVINSDGKVTGVLMETVAMGTVGQPTVTQDSQKGLARANDVYLAKGVAIGDAGGAMLMGDAANNIEFQTGLSNGNLTMRALIHPILNAQYYGAGNLISLGWEGLGFDEINATSERMVESGLKPGANSPATGQDITKRAMLLTPTFTVPSNLPDNYLFLGAYKILGDGSPQAYTAWMKDPGFYDWEDYTAENRFALYGTVDGHSPIYGTKYDTVRDSAAPTEPPYFNGLPGTVNVYPTDLQNLLEVVHRAGHSTEIHCNGSAYAEAWVEALEKTISKHPEITDTRHCSIHAQTFERNMLERMSGRYSSVDKSMTTQLFGALGQPDRGQPGTVFDSAAVNGMTEAQLSQAMKAQNLFANFFITHTYFYGERHRDKFFGPGRANNISPVGWAVALDVPYAFHNDTDVTPIDPLQSVESAVTRLSAKSLVSPGGQYIGGSGHDLDATVTLPSRYNANGPIPGSEMRFYNYDQRINGAQALLGVTITPAYQNKIDHLTGSIENGKFADLVILDDDPVQIAESDPTKLSDIRVTSTIIGGDVKYGVAPGSATYIFNVRPAYAPDPNINSNATITNLQVREYASDSELVPLERGQVRYGAFSVSGEVTNSTTATLQMHALGNGSAISDFTMYINGQPAQYGISADPNHFWVAASNAPTVVIDPGQKMEMNRDYIIAFTLPTTTGTGGAGNVFSDKVEVVSTGVVPTNRASVREGWTNGGGDDDDSSGCTVGSRPAYDLGILALMFAALVAFGGLRRVFSRRG